MCSDETTTLRSRITHLTLALLVCAMSLVAAVAVALGWQTLEEGLGAGHWGRATAEYFWITFWIVLAAALATLVGYVALIFLSRSIARPIARLAGQADEITEKGGTAQFRTGSGIMEIDLLSTSFNRLFALQERQADELRELVRDVLHDIRTPLSHISQQAQCIYDGSCEPKCAAGLIAESCDKVVELFETHAEIARNNAFAVCERPAELNLSEMIAFVVDLYIPVAEEKGVKLSASMDKAAIMFTGHKAKLQSLLGNLIDNAIKFTPSGGSVAVTAFLSLDGIEMSVSDTGIGIDQASRKRIFERGFRANDAADQPGFGLGLALVKSIVALYHGSIGCESEPGKGTSFTVRLPTCRKAYSA